MPITVTAFACLFLGSTHGPLGVSERRTTYGGRYELQKMDKERITVSIQQGMHLTILPAELQFDRRKLTMPGIKLTRIEF